MTKLSDVGQDKAGRDYWNHAWDDPSLPGVWNVDSKGVGNYVERAFFTYLAEFFGNNGLIGCDKELVEVGCARSQVLPVLAKRFGMKVAGIDYSPNGCEQTRLILGREGVAGEVHCSDIFDIPKQLVGKFDVVISFGLIEHFSDTNAIVSALAKLLKPGGMIFTNIPNMRGVPGLVQKKMNRAIYDIHVPLTPNEMRDAHGKAGLNILDCDYFLSNNFGVLNLGESRTKALGWWFRKIILAVLARVSMSVWLVERLVGEMPVGRIFSPYINCVALKPAERNRP